MNISEKRKIVKDLNERLNRSKITILADFKGLDVSAITELRRELRKVDVELTVIKNTLLNRASEETDTVLLSDFFKGPTAIVLSYDDPVAPAKVLMNFAKNNKKLEIKAGVINGKVLNTESIIELSLLPSREVLLGQVLSVMNGVPTSFVRVLNEVPRSFLNVLQAIKDQKEAA